MTNVILSQGPLLGSLDDRGKLLTSIWGSFVTSARVALNHKPTKLHEALMGEDCILKHTDRSSGFPNTVELWSPCIKCSHSKGACSFSGWTRHCEWGRLGACFIWTPILASKGNPGKSFLTPRAPVNNAWWLLSKKHALFSQKTRQRASRMTWVGPQSSHCVHASRLLPIDPDYEPGPWEQSASQGWELGFVLTLHPANYVEQPVP